MKNITIIAAIGQNNELGKDNKLLWNLPEDLKFFKQQTMGKPIIMGKKTLDSLGKDKNSKQRLLPGRLHLVLTHQEIELNEQIMVFHDKESLVDYISTLDQEVMVIGGAQIYQQMLDLADKIILTEIAASKDADSYFPDFDRNNWHCEELSSHQEGTIKYKHLVYTKK